MKREARPCLELLTNGLLVLVSHACLRRLISPPPGSFKMPVSQCPVRVGVIDGSDGGVRISGTWTGLSLSKTMYGPVRPLTTRLVAVPIINVRVLAYSLVVPVFIALVM